MLKYLRMGNKRIKLIWWALVVVVVLTFVGGFIFLFGSGFDTGYQAQVSGALGTVNGEPISRVDLQNAVAEQRAMYRQRFKTDPGGQEGRLIEAQAWRGLVTQRLIAQQAKKLGLKAHDREVLITLQASPPQALLSLPDFQTNGQFDPNKYAAAIRNPNINWAPFEEMVRDQLPVRKLQERMVASIKLSQPELEQAYRRRFERVGLTVVTVPAVFDTQMAAPGDADLDRAYARYKGRFGGPARASLEVLAMPKQFSEDELRAAREQAQNLAHRARNGEDFAQLARDYSEGPGAEQGGEINRVFQPSEFGPELAPKMTGMNKGDVSDPIAQPGGFLVLKVLDRIPDPMSPTPSMRVAQILIMIRPGDEALRQQFETMRKVRDRAKSAGLAKAATEKGLATTKTSFFPFGSTPPQLNEAPNLADWAFNAKKGEVSPIVEGSDAFFLAQVAETREAGASPRADVVEQLRAIAESETRVLAARPRVDQLMQAVAQGKSLEDAARSVGLTAASVPPMSREQPDPRLAASPEAVGAAFSAAAGRILGPIQTPGAWVVMRVDVKVPADTASFEQLKGQITSDILQRRQNDFLQAWTTEVRRGAKVQDLRTP